jgi:ribonuclease BN (tRNA processing enzyme)
MVRTGDETLVFDLGSGAVRGMLHADLDPFAIDRIFFTHFHPDHTVDVIPLLFAMNYGADEPRTRPLYVTGPEPFKEFWANILDVWGQWMEGDYPLEVSELSHGSRSPIKLPDCDITWAPAEHRPESIAYRLESGDRAFVYTGDTEYSKSVVELARDADTMLIECSFPDDNPIPGHLTSSSVARIASEASVGRILLTHVYPAADELDLVAEVGEGYGGEIMVAEDGLTVSV